ncbi:FkbM family methyltransferase [Nocardiopsis changdeensis]|uniref:FkbM family methyltransferase n=1 Tax=Nocardiopsis changdeensis TaxID=2831969 RepID=A0ABX8BIT7_9ACTN|nr:MULTISPECIES: FkbM family methyltransferase [Nocardiopsis]QUX21984.1 FkbM family methyltransferase [Nocardiopsis changdeensis]QYX37921.1 FkbM family methyltransferase [Nocardiopsis sp. MT53]
MVTDHLREIVRRYPLVRFAARRLRVRLPRSMGGLDPGRVPPWSRTFTLALPEGGAGDPRELTLHLPGYLTVPRRLAAHGLAGHGPDALSCFLAMLDRTRPGAVLDVGSGVGVYAMLAATRSRRPVFAFEPTPEIALAARSAAEATGRGFTVVEAALSNHNGSAYLRRARHNDMCNTIGLPRRQDLSGTTVRAATLSRWCESEGCSPAVVKIDTAGTEPDVVAGGLGVLRRFRPWLLVRVRPGRGLEERLMALLDPLEYTWYPVNGRPPYQPSREIAARSSPAWERMWLLTPEPAGEGFWAAARAWREALAACS